MSWKNAVRLATEWADAKRTELVTTDRRVREDAEAHQDELGREAEREAGTSLLEAVLPPSLARHVTAARPENVAARAAEAAAHEDAERRARLAAAPVGEVRVGLAGGEHASASLGLAVERTLVDGWLVVRAEAPDPVELGTTSLFSLSVAVPGYAGPGRYDLHELHRRSEDDGTGPFEPWDLHLAPGPDAGETTWYYDAGAPGPAVVEVDATSVSFDLPMTSAVSRVRLTGGMTWADGDGRA